jgi:hypothetical protein
VPNQDWIALVGIATNFTIIVTGIKLIRHLSRMELKVEMMWGVFMRQFGTRGIDKIKEDSDDE